MYCRNCGKELPPGVEFCIGCGVRPLNANKFCQNCGAKTNPQQEVCLKCGTLLKREDKQKDPTRKNQLVALLLCLFVGWLGVHRYYMGRVVSGVAMFILYLSGFAFLFAGYKWSGLYVFAVAAVIGFFVWWIIDLISIATGKMKDGEGRELSKSG
jgi:TM2 domain-containing membrane protein YozV